MINTKIFFISERFYLSFDQYLTFLNVFFSIQYRKILRFISFILEEIRSILKKNVQFDIKKFGNLEILKPKNNLCAVKS